MTKTRLGIFLVLGLLIAFPLVAPSFGFEFYVSFVRRILIFALAASALNLVLGYGGLVALGHAAFFGAGAYVVGIMADAGIYAAWVVWPVAMALAALLACITGAISLRTKGVYFIMITLAFAQMIYYLFISLRQYGGEDGMNLYDYSSLPGLDLSNDVQFYYVVLAIVVVAFLVFKQLMESRFGHALRGAKENPSRMQALGYPVYGIQLVAYTLSGALMGLAGALLANHNLFVSPSLMHWTQSADLIIMVLVGGMGLMFGGVAGAAVLLVLEEILRNWTEFWHLPLGVLLLIVVFAAPQGLASWFDKKRVSNDNT
ncbi:branched-chain amino acid transport system permease protein [Paenalcaligenes hominis]|uniref:Branched-chain amino acid transport system permease protein n=1 Tax=Paenalcaligenes hominis TaxID=643674 RepID=A0ABX0WPT2_9BURK|nr:branched-chain amino acid ABC transporter permease [Paenalcaligenes hominis]NJB64007.1 branched-chain amino acid transport system permease protein [Paenalcaligenes hominis]GGE62388.1 branched-chain amino acid ABC transporter permease [Paenalcaligenes hominis]